MRPVEGRNLLEVVVDEPSLPQEFSRTTLGQERQKEVFELNEADSEVCASMRMSLWGVRSLTSSHDSALKQSFFDGKPGR